MNALETGFATTDTNKCFSGPGGPGASAALARIETARRLLAGSLAHAARHQSRTAPPPLARKHLPRQRAPIPPLALGQTPRADSGALGGGANGRQNDTSAERVRIGPVAVRARQKLVALRKLAVSVDAVSVSVYISVSVRILSVVSAISVPIIRAPAETLGGNGQRLHRLGERLGRVAQRPARVRADPPRARVRTPLAAARFRRLARIRRRRRETARFSVLLLLRRLREQLQQRPVPRDVPSDDRDAARRRLEQSAALPLGRARVQHPRALAHEPKRRRPVARGEEAERAEPRPRRFVGEGANLSRVRRVQRGTHHGDDEQRLKSADERLRGRLTHV